MADVGNVRVRIGGDASELKRAISDANRSLNSISKEVYKVERSMRGLSRMGDQLRSLGRGLTIGLSAPLAALGAVAVKNAADLDSLTRALDAVTGSSAETARELASLREAAKQPGLGFQEAIQGSVQLQSVGYSAAFAERALKEFGNAIALTGGGREELQQVTIQLGQMAAAGKLLTRDIRPIITQAPAVAQAMKKAFGTVDAEQINKLGYSSDQFLTKLLDQMGELPRVSGGIKNALENLQTSIFTTSGAIGKQLVPAVTLAVGKIETMLTALSDANGETLRWGLAIGAVVATVGPVTLAVGALARAVVALSAAFSVGAGPIGLAVLGLGALSAVFVKSKLDALEAAGALDRFKAAVGGLNKAGLQAKRTDLLGQRDALKGQIQRFDEAASHASGSLKKHFQAMAADARQNLGSVLAQFQSVDKALQNLASSGSAAGGAGGTGGTGGGLVAALGLTGLDATAKTLAALRDRVTDLHDALGKARMDRAFETDADAAGKLDERIQTLKQTIQATTRAADQLAAKLAFDKQSTFLSGAAKLKPVQSIQGGIPRPLVTQVEKLHFAQPYDVAKLVEDARRFGIAMTDILDTMPREVRTKVEAEMGKLGSHGFGKIADTATQVSQGVLALSDAMGGLDESSRRTLQGLNTLSRGVSDFIHGDLIGGSFEIVGGLFQSIKGLFGKSDAEKAREAALQQNTLALQSVRQGLVDLSSSALATSPGKTVSSTLEAAQFALSQRKRGDTDIGGNFQRELARLGVTMEQAKAIAASYGIELRTDQKDMELFVRTLKQTSVVDIFRGFTGQMDLLQRKFELFDISEPAQKFDYLRTLFLQSVALPAGIEENFRKIDLSTTEGQNRMQEFVQNLFKDFQSGALKIGELGDLSAQQFLDMLGQMEGLGDEMSKLGDTANSVAESLKNVPTGFKVALARFNATALDTGTTTTPMAPGSRRGGGIDTQPVPIDVAKWQAASPRPISGGDVTFTGDIYIEAGPGADGKVLWEKFTAEATRQSRRGGATQFDVAVRQQ